MYRELSGPLNRFAPLVTAVVLGMLIMLGGIDARRYHGLEAYMAEVRQAIEEIPFNIGGAVGTDVEPTSAAVRILAPNKILQRRYVDPLTGSSMSLLLVHCGDVRDMLGHYPPVCYPAHGWQSGMSRAVPVEIGGTRAMAVVYEFFRADDLVERRMTVLNFFILPGEEGRFAPDMKAVERIARTQSASGLGVGQVQIVMDGRPTSDEKLRIAAQVLPALEPVVLAIGRGVER